MLPICIIIDYNGGMKSEEQNHENQSFMREKVVRRGVFKRRVLWAVRIVVGAVLFGLVSCLVFVCAKPWLEDRFYPEPEETMEPITLPWDEEPTTETPAATETETETAETEETVPLEEQIQEIIDSNHLTFDDYKRLNGFLSTVMSQANQGIVALTAGGETAEEGGFLSGEVALPGALFMVTESEGLILTDYSRMEGCQQFSAHFNNGLIAQAELKAADTVSGIAVLRISREWLEQAGIQEQDVLELGSSYTATLGQSVILVGNPFGAVYSAAAGQLVYMESGKGGIDNERRMLYADISTVSGGGFLINLDGQILGMTTDNTREETGGAYTNFLAITDLKTTIEMLANGRNMAYLGIRGTAVTKEKADTLGMPEGVYITEVVQGSPAYNIGIQTGDVIAALDDTPVGSIKDIQAFLAQASPGQGVSAAVYRQGKEEFVEQVYTVTLGAR
jgi:S1-C subfamily serine protease